MSDAGPRFRIRLGVREHGLDEVAHVFEGTEVIIGRSVGHATLVLRAGNVCKKHCRIRVEPDGTAWMDDMGSTNGTYVNGRKASSVPVAVDDKIYVGDFVIRLAEPPKPLGTASSKA